MANRFTLGQTEFEKTESAKAYEAKTGMDVSIAENMKYATGQSADFSKAATTGTASTSKTAKNKTTPLPSTTKAGKTTFVNIRALGAGGDSAVSAGKVGQYDNTPKKKTPTAAEAEAAQAEYDRLMSIDLQRLKADIERQQKLAANSRTAPGMINGGGTFLGGSATTNVRDTTAAEQRLAELQRDYNRAEEVQRYARYEQQLSELSDKNREIVQALAEFDRNTLSAKYHGVPMDHTMAVGLQRIVERSGYTADEVKALVDAQVRVNNKADYVAKQEKWAATARGEDNIGGITGATWASVASVGENLISGIGYLDVLSQNMANVGKEEKAPIDYYTGAMSHAAAVNAARSEVSNLIIEKSKAKNPDKENAGQILSFLYQTGMSMADSGVIAASALLGVPATAGTLLLGGAAASSTLMDAHQRGLSDTQAILTATAAGVAETVFEKISIEKLLPNLEAPLSGSIKQMVRDASKRLVEQGIVEASEEGFTTIANTALDALINGNLSEYNQNLYRYMATMSPTEAKDAAWKDLMKGLGLDMLGGFLSGGLMAGAPNFARVTSYSNEMNVLAGQTFTAQGLLNTAVNLGVQGDTVAKVSKAVADGKSVSNATMHALAIEVAKKSLQNSMPQVTSTIAEQLSQSGETSADAAGLVDALSHAYVLAASNLQDVFTYEAAAELYGPTLTKAEQTLIAESDAGNQTLSRMLQVPINIKLTSEVSQEAAVSAENDVTVNSGDIKSTVLANAVQQAQANGVVTKAMVNSILKSSDALEELGVVRSGQSDVKIRKEIKEKLTNLAGDLLESAALDKSKNSADNKGSVTAPDTEEYRQFAAKMRETYGADVPEQDIIDAYTAATTVTIDGETFTNQEFMDAYKKAHPNASEQEVTEALMQAKAIAQGLTAREGTLNENERTHGNDRGLGRTSGTRTGKQAGGSRQRASGTKTAVRSRRVGSVRRDSRGQGQTGQDRKETAGGNKGSSAGSGSNGRGASVLNSQAARHAESVRALSLPTERASYAPGVTVNRVTDLSSLPEKDRANADRMAAKAKSLGAEVWFVLGDTRPGRKNAEGKPLRTYGTTYFDGSGKPIIVVSLDSKRYLPSALFSHELIHAIQIQSGRTSVEAILSGISEESIADVEEALTDLASPYNKSYSGSFGGEFNENNRLDYWEEVLGDIYANINRLGFTNEDFAALRKKVLPLISEESAKYENADGAAYQYGDGTVRDLVYADSSVKIRDQIAGTDFKATYMDENGTKRYGFSRASDIYSIPRTPNVLVSVGFNQRQLGLSRNHIAEYGHDEGRYKDATNLLHEGHDTKGVDAEDVVQRLPELLERPALILTSRTHRDAAIVVLDEVAKTKDGKLAPVCAVVRGDYTFKEGINYTKSEKNGKTVARPEGFRREVQNYIASVGERGIFRTPGRGKETADLSRALLNAEMDRSKQRLLYWDEGVLSSLCDKLGIDNPSQEIREAGIPSGIRTGDDRQTIYVTEDNYHIEGSPFYKTDTEFEDWDSVIKFIGEERSFGNTKLIVAKAGNRVHVSTDFNGFPVPLGSYKLDDAGLRDFLADSAELNRLANNTDSILKNADAVQKSVKEDIENLSKNASPDTKSAALERRREVSKVEKVKLEKANQAAVAKTASADPAFRWSDNAALNDALANPGAKAVAQLQKRAADALRDDTFDEAVMVLSNFNPQLEDMAFAASDESGEAFSRALQDMRNSVAAEYAAEHPELQNQDLLDVARDFGETENSDEDAYWDEWEKALDTLNTKDTSYSAKVPPAIPNMIDPNAPEADAWGAIYTKWNTGTEVYEFPSYGAILGYAQELADYIGLDGNSLDTTAYEGYLSAPSLTTGELIPMFKLYPGNVVSAGITNYRDPGRTLRKPNPASYGADYDMTDMDWTFPDMDKLKEFLGDLAKYHGFENVDVSLASYDFSLIAITDADTGELYAEVEYAPGYYPEEVVVSADKLTFNQDAQDAKFPGPKAEDYGGNEMDDGSYGFSKGANLLSWAEALGKYLGLNGTAVFDESLKTVEILHSDGTSDVLFPYDAIGKSKFVDFSNLERLLGKTPAIDAPESGESAPELPDVAKAALGKMDDSEFSDAYSASWENYGESISFDTEEGFTDFIWDAIEALGIWDDVAEFEQDIDRKALVLHMEDGSEQVLLPLEDIYTEGAVINANDLAFLLGDVRPDGYENAPWVNPRVKDNDGHVPSGDVFKVSDGQYYDRVTGREVFATSSGFQYSLMEDAAHMPLQDKLDYFSALAEQRLLPPEAPQQRMAKGAGRVVNHEKYDADWLHPSDIDTDNFRSWFNDPTESHELTMPDGTPRLLYTGTNAAGFTAHDPRYARSAKKGIWTTNDFRGASAYMGSDQVEFKPAVLKDWDTAIEYTRKSLKMQLRKEDNSYTLYYFSAGGWMPTASYSADQSGLDLFNEQYGEIHSDYRVPTSAFYKVYGTASRALVVDCYGRSWSAIGVGDNGGGLATDDLVNHAFSNGYDLVIFKNVHDGAYTKEGRPTLMNDYVFKDSGQVKSVYNTGTWDRGNADMRYMAEDDANARAEALGKLIRRAETAYQAAQRTEDKRPHSAKEAGSVAQQDDSLDAWVIYSSLGRQYGTIPQTGRRNVRPVRVPVRVSPDTKVHKTTSTVMSAAATPNRRLRTIAEAVVDGKLSYTPDVNKIQINKANAHIKKVGFQRAVLEWTSDVSKGKVTGDLVAMGATLLNNAGNASASGEAYLDILDTYTTLLQNAGQALQAAKILKSLTPTGKLYMVGRKVDKINNELREHGFDPSKYPDVEIDPELIKAYNKAKNDDERNAIMEQITQNIADQIKATPMDKFTAWRYLAMLGNFRTQVRNLAGNTFMQPARMLKESIAGLTEALLERMGVDIDRTTSAVADMPTFKAALADFKNVRDIILAGGKYDDSRSLSKAINDKRRIFKSAILEGYRKGTNFLMDEGDAVFCSFTYADALARFMAANHTTWESATEELRDKGREVAIREAAEATYRDSNAFSNLILNLRIKNPTTGVGKVAAAAVEGVLPFRKTPANILVRTVEYSPLYILKTAHDAVQLAKGTGNVTAADVVNEAAKTLTGSGLLVLGAALASFGKLIGKAPDDDKERELWEAQGHQAYSLEIGGHSYTLDWAAPVCIPMFLGANLVQVFQEEGVSLSTVVDALNTITDPVLEMSMLQGIQDLIDNAANFGDEGALIRLTANALTSYISQVVPTMLGQTKRAFMNDNQRVQTYTDKNSSLPGDWQYALGKLAGKIPFWNYAQTVYTDAWGRTEANADNETLNIIQQFFSPGYGSRIQTSPMETELLRLSKATGEKSVLISKASKYFTVNGERKDLTADEYYSYNTTRGRTAYSLMTELVDSATYRNMTDAERVKAVEAVYDYANQVAKQTVAPGFEPSAWVGYAQSAPSELNISTLEYIVTKPDTKSFVSDVDNHPKYVAAVGVGLTVEQYTDLKANIDANGNGSTSQAEAKAYLDSTDLSREQKAAAWYIINKGWKKNPYGSLTSENKAILDNLYGAGWQDKK